METNSDQGYVKMQTDDGGVTTISFFHPLQNSLPSALLAQIAQSIRDAGDHVETKVIVLKSDGDSTFCAGANFNELLQINDKSSGQQFFSGFAGVINACRKSPKLIIGRVQGKAVGGGVGIAAAVDYCLATNNAAVKLSELTIGIGPFVIEPAVTRKIGISAFTQLTLNAANFFTAQWAKENGLFSELYQDAVELDSAITNLTKQLSGYNPDAAMALKSALWTGTENWDMLLSERAAISGELILSAFAQEAINKLRPSKH